MDDARLPESELRHFLHLLADQACDHAVMLLSLEGEVRWWSEGARRIFGYERDEILGQPVARLFLAEDVAAGIPEYERRVARHDTAADDDRWMRRADGSRFWAAGALTPLHDEAGRLVGFGKIVRNRTDLRTQIDTLRNRVAELEGLLRGRDVFLATLSHELRNPLAPLANALQLLRLGGVSGKEGEFALRIIERQMALMQRLVDDILDVARAGAGKIELERRRLDLGEVLRQAAESSAPVMRNRGHRLEVVLPELPMPFEGDPERMQQVFGNLLANAARYTPPGGRVWVKAAADAHEVIAHVEDNGQGISPEMLPRIFDLFTQAEGAMERAAGGLGIGLALVKDLVTLHGGSVQARSEGPGKGAEFTVRLPRAGAPGASA